MTWTRWVAVGVLAASPGCVTPAYTIRPTPVPEESAWIRQLEQTISAYQARELEQDGVRAVSLGEQVFGFDLARTVDQLSRVTERPNLPYRVLVIPDDDPNAAALADGRVYVSTGMLRYLASRGSPRPADHTSRPPRLLPGSGRGGGHDSELAFILAHELAHTVAQHLVKRYRQLRQQQMMMALVGMGTAIATKDGTANAHQIGDLAYQIASVVNDVIVSGFSQEQELEADQLGIRYVIQAGYDPRQALSMLEDFTRFEVAWPFFRTHPYIQRRAEDLRRYLTERGHLSGGTPNTPVPSSWREEQRQRLREAQTLYPVGSQSWQNIQRQLEELDRR